MSAQNQKKCFQCMESFLTLSDSSQHQPLVQMQSCTHKICIHCLKKIQDKKQSILSCGFCGVIVRGEALQNIILKTKGKIIQPQQNLLHQIENLQQFLDQKPQAQQISFLLGADSYKHICEQQEIKKNYLNDNLQINRLKDTHKNCSIHQKTLEIVCLQDKNIICAHCAIFGDHKGHNVIQLGIVQKQLQKKKSKINEIIMSQKEFSLKMKQKQLKSQYMQKLTCKKQQNEQNIKKQYQNLRDLLVKSEESALDSLRKCYELIQQKLNSCLKGQKQLKTIYSKWSEDATTLLKQIQLGPLSIKVQLFLHNFSLSSVQSCNSIVEVDRQGKKYFQQMKQSLQVSLEDIQRSIGRVKIQFDQDIANRINKFAKVQFPLVKIKENLQEEGQCEFMDNSFIQKCQKTLNSYQNSPNSKLVKSGCQFKSITHFGSSNRLLTQANFSQTVKFPKSKSPKCKVEQQSIRKPLKYNRRDTLQDYKNMSKKFGCIKSSIDCQQILSTISIADSRIIYAISSKSPNNYKHQIQKTERKQIIPNIKSPDNINSKLSRCRSNDGHRKKASMDTMDTKFTTNQFKQPIQIFEQFKKSDSETFDLTNCNINDSQIIYFLDKAKKHKKIKNLKLSSNKLTTAGFQKLIPFLGNCNLLNVSHNFLTQDTLDILFKKKDRLPNLKMVNISNNKIISDPKKLKGKIQNLKKIGIMITL